MPAGEISPPEGATFQDPLSGANVRQLTDWRAHSHHLYFTNSGLWDAGRRLVFASHRNNRVNLYSVELATGEITQLTDFAPADDPKLLTAFVNPVRDEAYFTWDGQVVALDLRSFRRRVLYRVPDGWRGTSLSCTADGRLVCLAVCEDLSDRIRTDFLHGYVGFAEYSAARPLCRIVAIPTDDGEARTVDEEKFWLNRVNTSPTLADVLTFCHEGPWNKVEQRMWVLDIPSGNARPLRKQSPGERIGHEYWFADGRRVGYHGSKDGMHRFGMIEWDGGGLREWGFPHGSTHFHSIDETLVVGDGGRDRPFVLLWRLRDGRYEGPRILAEHRGSFHVQILHVHPRMFQGLDGLSLIHI